MATKSKAEQLEELRIQQSEGVAPKRKGNVNSEFEINAHDQDYVHVIETTRVHNANAKTYSEHVKPQMYHPAVFDQMLQNNSFIGADSVEVIHDPRKEKELAPSAMQKQSLKVDMTNREGLPAIPAGEVDINEAQEVIQKELDVKAEHGIAEEKAYQFQPEQKEVNEQLNISEGTAIVDPKQKRK